MDLRGIVKWEVQILRHIEPVLWDLFLSDTADQVGKLDRERSDGVRVNRVALVRLRVFVRRQDH